MEQIFAQVDQFMRQIFDNQWISAAMVIFLTLYAGLAAPDLPPAIAVLFENPLVKLLFLFAILLIQEYSPTVSILVALGFLLSIQALKEHRIFEMNNELMEYANKVKQPEDPLPSGITLEDTPLDCPGCGMIGGGCGCLFKKRPVEEEEDGYYDPYGFLGDEKPQPQETDLVLPPQTEVPTQVGVVFHETGEYYGPQGMQEPKGYSGKVQGATF